MTRKKRSANEILKSIKIQLRASYEQLGTWRAVAKLYNLPVRTIHKIATHPIYYPKKDNIQKALGLPKLALAESCPHCGNIHTTKRCPAKRKPPRDLFALPVQTLKAMIRNREDVDA